MSNQALVEFFTEAGAAVQLMADKVAGLVGLLRDGQRQQANEVLATLAPELRDLVVMIGVVQGPLGIEPSRLTVDGVLPDEQITRLGAWLESTVAAQAAGDWDGLADTLERHLHPLLRGWITVLHACATAS